MRKALSIVAVFALALLLAPGLAVAEDLPVGLNDQVEAAPAVETPADPCALPESDGPFMMMNSFTNEPVPVPAQISVPRCNCTLRGTPIPPGQLGVLCASPIGGPLVTCQNVVCYTLISTPWINGVCG